MEKRISAARIAHYRARIEATRPDLAIQSLAANSEGMINDVLLVNDREVFRFPRDAYAVEDLWQEAGCLALAREHVALRLPAWTIYEPRDGHPPFAGYEMIPGEALRREQILRLPEADQAALAAQTLADVKNRIKELNMVKAASENEIKAELKEAAMGVLPDGAMFTWKEVTRRSAKALKDIPRELHEQVAKEIKYRQLRYVARKETAA